MGLFLADPGGDLALTSHGVDRHRRAGDAQQIQQFGDGRDLVALVCDGQLPQHQLVVRRPGADQVDRRLLPLPRMTEAAPQRLAVDGHHVVVVVAAHRLGQVAGPGDEAAFEGVGVQPRKDAGERVGRGDAVGQGQEGLEPVMTGPGPDDHVIPVIGGADHREDREGEDVGEHVADIMPPGVFQITKMAREGRGRCGVHAKLLGEGLDDKTPAGNGQRTYPRSRDRARRKILTCGCPGVVRQACHAFMR